MGNCESSLSEDGNPTDFEILRKKIQTKLDFETHREAKWLRKILKLKEKELEIKECELQQLQLTAELRNRKVRELEQQLEISEREKRELMQALATKTSLNSVVDLEPRCAMCSNVLKTGALTPRSPRSPSMKDLELEKLKKAIQAYKDQMVSDASLSSPIVDKPNVCKVRKISIEKMKGKKQDSKSGTLSSPKRLQPKIPQQSTLFSLSAPPAWKLPIPLSSSQVAESFFKESQLYQQSESNLSDGLRHDAHEPDLSNSVESRTVSETSSGTDEQEPKKNETAKEQNNKPDEKRIRIRPYDPIIELKIHIEKLPIKVMHPPRFGKKCLVLDIDYTMFDNEFFSSKLEDASYLNRPYLHEFMEICYAYYDIILWSATSVRAIDTKMKRCGVYSHPNYKITMVLSKTDMFQLQTAKSPIDTKALQLLWTKFPDYYTPKNTIHIDDLPQNFTLNPQQGLRVKQYRESSVNKFFDKELFYLSLYLTIISKFSDFSHLDHSQFKEYTMVCLYERLLKEINRKSKSPAIPISDKNGENIQENGKMDIEVGDFHLPSFRAAIPYPSYPKKKDMIIDWFGVVTNISIFKKPISEESTLESTSQPGVNLTRSLNDLASVSRPRSLTAPVRHSHTLSS